MRVLVVVVGKPREPGLAAAIEEFEKRAARYWPLEVHEVREESARAASADLVREREGERLLAKIPAGTDLVACDVDGAVMRSDEFARWLQRTRESARSVAFVVGGAYGLTDSVRARARFRLSLAHWTLPHELARLVLAEQLYRAGTIVRGEPYHK
ncbi:MAG: 23S rRNA (pseudouridine(1915)-N(3))-methyltransferase RlmH [Gemmatimonadaceae bacterium]|nr:23S rRNA (pseudouridine(1915)-N(3))-methyltransferase RlmH [Gemmatimonadaceae bacterium]NUQ94530.1 23S rRNA (pseudouridine(1915)-N(3))-methyltransferase RlmH [Gemmatimonadaceae bacterium]NUR20567.1 23S rRNA (pseudouridine(1915)-N(3))-methyltransferase RlmH [Gemmatimonadaceae bacterium]NUS98340.1 23S rRNA (pseudouridine(1915)-N(3))-methyltransferase RlmH [Gemmatimonadaceae bacterium]